MPELARKISDIIKPQEPFYPDAEKVPLSALIDQTITIHEVQLRKEVKSNFGPPHDLMLVAFTSPKGRTISTTSSSHSVIVKKLKEINQKKAFPVTGKFIQVPSGDNTYYDLVDGD